MFIEHMKTYELKFNSGKEFVKRLEIFIAQVEEVTEWNKDPSHTWRKGLNAYSHLTGDEWKEHMRLTPMPSKHLRKGRSIPGSTPLVHGEPTTPLGAFSTSKVGQGHGEAPCAQRVFCVLCLTVSHIHVPRTLTLSPPPPLPP